MLPVPPDHAGRRISRGFPKSALQWFIYLKHRILMSPQSSVMLYCTSARINHDPRKHPHSSEVSEVNSPCDEEVVAVP